MAHAILAPATAVATHNTAQDAVVLAQDHASTVPNARQEKALVDAQAAVCLIHTHARRVPQESMAAGGVPERALTVEQESTTQIKAQHLKHHAGNVQLENTILIQVL